MATKEGLWAIPLEGLPPSVTVKMVCEALNIGRATLMGMVERGKPDRPLSTGTSRKIGPSRVWPSLWSCPASEQGGDRGDGPVRGGAAATAARPCGLDGYHDGPGQCLEEAGQKASQPDEAAQSEDSTKMSQWERATRTALLDFSGSEELATLFVGMRRWGAGKRHVFRLPPCQTEAVEATLRRYGESASAEDEQEDATACLQAAKSVRGQIDAQLPRGDDAGIFFGLKSSGMWSCAALQLSAATALEPAKPCPAGAAALGAKLRPWGKDGEGNLLAIHWV